MNAETETTICEGEGCGVPIEMPKVQQFGPALFFKPIPLCKDCLLKIQTAHFATQHLFRPPFKIPHWRPKA